MTHDTTRVLVLGASGMLGHAVFRVFAESPGFEASGTARSRTVLEHLPDALHARIQTGIEVENVDALMTAFARSRPHVVVNCVGLVKQLDAGNDVLQALPINAVLPHRLARLCEVAGARLVHLSTDCVFSGRKGNYTEADQPDAYDVYGRSKLLGEVDEPHAITLRTSIIGHELTSSRSLINWFLAQSSEVRGYKKAIFSGLPTVEIARVIRDHVIPNPSLRGLHHLSAAPINKFELLSLVADVYGKQIVIHPDDNLVIDRSLDSTRFRTATGYCPPSWPELIRLMHAQRWKA